MPDLLDHLQALEVELHHPGVLCTRERLEALLHPEFHEVGRSGCVYTRATVVAFLATQATPPPTQSDGFHLELPGEDMALLTYRSAQRQADGRLDLHTLRASLWVRSGCGWQLRYHQGTPARDPW